MVERHGGIGFLLIYFNKLGEIYLLKAKDLVEIEKRASNGGRKSIGIDEMREIGIPIKESYPIRIPYLNAVDLYIEEKMNVAK